MPRLKTLLFGGKAFYQCATVSITGMGECSSLNVDMPELQSIQLGLNAMKYHGNDSYNCALVLSSTNEMT